MKAAKRKVDVEAPAPGYLVSECSTYQWSNDRSNSEYASVKTLVGSSLLHWCNVGNDDEAAAGDASTANASNCALEIEISAIGVFLIAK